VETPKGTWQGALVALCTGFFPHLDLVPMVRNVRVVFSPPEVEARHLPAIPGDTVAVLGGGGETVDFAEGLRRLRPEVSFLVVLEHVDTAPPSPHRSIRVVPGKLSVRQENKVGLTVEVHPRSGPPATEECRFLLVDYNSYAMETHVTDFLAASGVERRKGYIVTGPTGETGIPGIVAAGNIVTPVSGVLTALDTGFRVGLELHAHLYREKYGKPPLVFPWLPRGGMKDHPLG